MYVPGRGRGALSHRFSIKEAHRKISPLPCFEIIASIECSAVFQSKYSLPIRALRKMKDSRSKEAEFCAVSVVCYTMFEL